VPDADSTMSSNIVRFVLLVVLALLVGSMFGTWVGYDPAGLSASAYVEQQQNAIRSLNTLLPAMGAKVPKQHGNFRELIERRVIA